MAQENLRRSGEEKAGDRSSSASHSTQRSVEDDEYKGIVCLDNVVNAKLRPCGYSATCRECTDELMNLKRALPSLQEEDCGVYLGQVAELHW